MNRGIKLTLASTLLFSLALLGCGGTSSEYDDASAGAAEVVESVAPEALEVTPELAAILAAADAADGESDQVVSQCTNCSLAMEGTPDHVTTVGDYELQFCSEGCLEDFSSKAESRLLALDLTGVETEANKVYVP